MAGADPESEALIWQLHRELNGLTRSSKRASTLISLDNSKKEPKPTVRPRVAGKKTDSGNQTGEENDVPNKKARRATDSGDKPAPGPDATGPTSRSVDAILPPRAHKSAQGVTCKKKSSLGGPPNDGSSKEKKQQREPLGKTEAAFQADDKPAAPLAALRVPPGPPTAPHPDQASLPAVPSTVATAPEPTPSGPPPTGPPATSPPALPIAGTAGVGAAGAAPVAGAASGGAAGAVSGGVAGQAGHPALVAQRSPLTAAAAQAAAEVKSKVQQRMKAAVSVRRCVKCFYAGVRWGISLAPENVTSRAELAAALNGAFAGEIRSCGGGEHLTVVFVDDAGAAVEVPSLRACKGRDDRAAWKELVNKAVKIYVRRST